MAIKKDISYNVYIYLDISTSLVFVFKLKNHMTIDVLRIEKVKEPGATWYLFFGVP